MGWESRDRGGSYYTRSRKVNGRVIREYVGGGVIGEITALEDAQARREREERARLDREERERVETLTRSVEELCEEAEMLARAALIAAGYRRHDRGEWRMRREH
jgi:hypothetical protein